MTVPKNMFDTLEEEFIDLIRSSGDVFSSLVAKTEETAKLLQRDTGEAGVTIVPILSPIITCIVEAVIETGENITHGTKSLTYSFLYAVRDYPKNAVEIIPVLSTQIMMTNHRLKGNLPQAAKGTVSGVIKAADEIGIETKEAAAIAAMAAVKTAYEISPEMGEKVLKALSSTIDGVTVVLKEFSGNKDARNYSFNALILLIISWFH